MDIVNKVGCSLVLSLPNDVVHKWNELCVGSSTELAGLRSGESEAVISLSKNASNSLLQITGKNVVDVSDNKCICTVMQTVVDVANVTDAHSTAPMDTSECASPPKVIKIEGTGMTGVTQPPEPARTPTRRSQRVKREPAKDDFVMEVKRRKLSLQVDGRSAESPVSKQSKRGRGRPIKGGSCSVEILCQDKKDTDSAKGRKSSESQVMCIEAGIDDLIQSNNHDNAQIDSKHDTGSAVGGHAGSGTDVKTVSGTRRSRSRNFVSKTESSSSTENSEVAKNQDKEKNTRKGKSILKTYSPDHKHSEISASQFQITDDELTDWLDRRCLLCGKQWKSVKPLKNHLLTCHQVSWDDQQEVLSYPDVDERRKRLVQLQELSNNELERLIKTDQEVSSGADETMSVVSKSGEKLGINEESKKAEDLGAPDNKAIQCCICARNYDSRRSLQRHVGVIHKIRWREYVDLRMLPDDERAKRARECTGVGPKRNQKKEPDISGQLIKCTVCAEMVPCEAYRDHLLNTHPDFLEVDTVINHMEHVLQKNAYRVIFDFMMDCTICSADVSMNTVHKHFKKCHRNHPECKDKLEEVLTLIRQKGNANRMQARNDRSALTIRYSCRHCSTIFYDMSSRSAHENYTCSYNEGRKRLYSCKHCGQKGTTENWYENHMKKHNPEGKNYVCVECGKTYKNRSGLQQHTAMKHRKVYKFVCGVCSKRFYVKSHYEMHMIKHTDVREHSCDLCQRAFKSYPCLRKHKETVHKIGSSTTRGAASVDVHTSPKTSVHITEASRRGTSNQRTSQMVSLLKQVAPTIAKPVVKTYFSHSAPIPSMVEQAQAPSIAETSSQVVNVGQSIGDREEIDGNPSFVTIATSASLTGNTKDLSNTQQEIHYLDYTYLENCVNVGEGDVTNSVLQQGPVVETENNDNSLPTFIVVKSADTEDASSVLDLSSLLLVTNSDNTSA